MIPKVVHYIWFGGKPLSSLAERCIASWREYLPGYEIRRWDESTFDVRQCRYCREAYEAGKWAFASDYARFKVLFEEGGVYLDTDVEVIRPMDDILTAGAYMGCEIDGIPSGIDHGEGSLPMVNSGLGMATEAGSDLYREIIASYEKSSFVCADGSLDQTTVVERVSSILACHGLRADTEVQHVAGVRIYPAEFFNPKDCATGRIHLTANTHSIHHFDGTWLSEEVRAYARRKDAYAARHPKAPKYAIKLAAVVLACIDMHSLAPLANRAANRFGGGAR